jgi:hypothetical protein
MNKLLLFSMISLFLCTFHSSESMRRSEAQGNPVFGMHKILKANRNQIISGNLNDHTVHGVKPYRFRLLEVGQNITAAVEPNGDFTIAPAENFIGRSVIWFEVTDAAGSKAKGTVSVRFQ